MTTIDLITVECLRGRLLAERQVSRSAKEEAELITKKVISYDHKCHSCFKKASVSRSESNQEPIKSHSFFFGSNLSIH